ncbi:hypothetical protein A53 [Sulfolobus turreted icosahedral virus 1]|uniref:Uncharacterized protein n=1 Tax=Sulfolobus turreted icosahedral virus 1 TaxID=269145 RepID=Q6Q0K8_9VIRU|nr:hypothetical protein A53 [Sulfolobus turreted icosahedral virus 1]AAS89083.1 hypothetical protein A53 [Sulfolobus turreted icosahedral virus 1]
MKVEEDWEEVDEIEEEVDEICSRVTCEDCVAEICGDLCEILCEEEQDLMEEVE